MAVINNTISMARAGSIAHWYRRRPRPQPPAMLPEEYRQRLHVEDSRISGLETWLTCLCEDLGSDPAEDID
jgi:hypothetical protein